MERALLERMVGAVVLVLLLVLVAPLLLDGRTDTGRVTDSVADRPRVARELSAKRTEVIVLNAPVNAAAPKTVETVVSIAPAAGSSADGARPAKPRAASASNEQSPAGRALSGQQAGKAPRRAPAGELPDGYAVQVNAFTERGNAERYAARVKSDGFPVFVVRGSSSAGVIYRVYSGPVENRDAAGTLAARLQARGYKGIVVQLGADRRG